jgi:MFS family permease
MRLSAPSEITLPHEQSNYRHFILDMTYFGLASAAINRFMSVYAIRLGATPIEIGLIASLPAIILLFSSAFGGWWMRRHDTRTDALRVPSILFRFLFLLPAFAPFMPLHLQPLWLILSVAVPALPQGVAGVTFMVMMRESIHDAHITSLVSSRQMALNIAVGISALTFGLWLEKAPFPFNYQAMFVVAFVFAMMSQRHCMKVNTILQDEHKSKAQNKVSPWRSPKFLRVAFVVLVSHIAFTSMVAITPLRLVNELHANEGFMALFGLAELVAGATITLFTTRIVERVGNQAMIAMAMIGTSLAALVIALSPSLPMTLLGAALSGGSWTAAAVGVYGFFTQNTPKEDVTRYSTAYQQIIGLAMFIGPMLGSGLANASVKIVLVLLVCAALRLLAGALIEFDVFWTLTRLSRERLGALSKETK